MEIKDAENWNLLTQTINKEVKFKCEEYNKNFLSRRVEVRLRTLNLNSYKEYAEILKNDEKEQQKLRTELTIHVTHFFRDKEFYDAFKDEIIPLLKNKKEIKIWSAGCSTGEEPYSIVICFKEKLGENLENKKISIIAQDYCQDTIEKAKIGEYEEYQFREMPIEYKEKYFEKINEKYKVKEDLKKYVKFETADILREKPRNLDIIICRNTVIYFEAETKAKLYVDFYDILNKEGIFILGKTETINGPAREKFKVLNAKERIYKKE